MNNRKSPIKHHQQQRMKTSHSIPVANTNNRMRSNSSMGTSYPKNFNSYYRHYSNTNSPTAMSASSLPAVPLFYSNTYADPPECASLPQPPESWYLKPNDNDEKIPTPIVEVKEKVPTPIIEVKEKVPTPIVEVKEKSKQKPYYTKKNKGFYSPFYSSTVQTPYISVRA